MQADLDPDGALLLTYDSRQWSVWLTGATALLLGTAAYDWFIGTRGDDRLIGLFGGAATCALSALAMFETASFRADPAGRVVQWSRRWGFRRRRGSFSFDAVDAVVVDVPIGDDGVPSRRIVVHLKDGTQVPVTVGYRPDIDDAIAGAAQQLRRLFGLAADVSAEESARWLVERGRTVEAVRLLVEREGLSLTDAKTKVDRLRRST